MCSGILPHPVRLIEQQQLLHVWIGEQVSLDVRLSLNRVRDLPRCLKPSGVRCVLPTTSLTHIKRFEQARFEAAEDKAEWLRREYFSRY